MLGGENETRILRKYNHTRLYDSRNLHYLVNNFHGIFLMSLEKKFQGEVPKSLGRLGFCMKLQTDTQICFRCHTKLNPRHVGLADYLLVTSMGRASFIEVKDGDHLFKFADITDEQHSFMSRMGTMIDRAYLWIFMKPKDSKARLAWLVEYNVFREKMEALQALGYQSMHLSVDYAQKSRKIPELTLMEGLKDWQLEWMKGGVWRPQQFHSIWDTPADYDTFMEMKSNEWF